MKLLNSALLGVILLIGLSSKATTYTSVANGSWSSSATWSPAGVPGQSDTVILASPYKVTSSSADIAIGTLSGGMLIINSGANLDMGLHDLSFSHSATLENDGTLSVSTLELNSGTSLTNSGILTGHTSITLSTTGTVINSGTFNTSVLTLNNSVSFINTTSGSVNATTSFTTNTSSAFVNSGSFSTGSLTLDDATLFTSTGSVTASSLTTNSTSSFTDKGTMTVSTSITINASSTISVAKSITLNDKGSFDDYSSAELTDNGAILVTGTASFYGGTSISGSGYLTGGEIASPHNIAIWGVPKTFFPCHSCTIPNIALPIELISFTAEYTNDAVEVLWSSATEVDNNYYILSRSTDGVNYDVIATIKGAGQSSTRRDYTYADQTASSGVNYYRLQQTDFDGTTAFLGTTAATITLPAKEVKVFPNPAKSNCVVSFSDEVQENFQVTVYDCTGRQVQSMDIQTTKGENNIELNTSALSAGMYFVTLPVNGSVLKARVVKY